MAQNAKKVFLGLLLCSVAAPAARAQDIGLGPITIRGSAGAAFVAGGERFRRRAGVGPALGGAVLVNPFPAVGLFFAYDRPQAGRWLESESMTMGLRFSGALRSGLIPFLEAGAGVGRTDTSRSLNHFAAKAGIGLEMVIVPQVSLGMLLDYHLIEVRGSLARSLHELVPAAFAAYHFGSK